MKHAAGFSGKVNVIVVILLVCLGGFIHFLYISKLTLRKQAYAFYTAIFHGCQNDNFQIKNCNMFFIILLKT